MNVRFRADFKLFLLFIAHHYLRIALVDSWSAGGMEWLARVLINNEFSVELNYGHSTQRDVFWKI